MVGAVPGTGSRALLSRSSFKKPGFEGLTDFHDWRPRKQIPDVRGFEANLECPHKQIPGFPGFQTATAIPPFWVPEPGFGGFWTDFSSRIGWRDDSSVGFRRGRFSGLPKKVFQTAGAVVAKKPGL